MNCSGSLKEEFFRLGRVPGCPVYDLHGHMGPWRAVHFPVWDAASMVESMERDGIKFLVFCHHAALLAPDIGNQANMDAVREFPEKLRAYCAVNPNYPELVERDIADFEGHRDIYIGFKFLADYHGIPITDSGYRKAWELADSERLLVLLHTWGRSIYSGHEQIRQVAGKYPGAKILLGHSCHGDWDKAIELAGGFGNIYLELCAVLDERGILERFVAEVGSGKIVFGTDFPWFGHSYYIGAVLGANLPDTDSHNIFHVNAEKLLNGLW